MSDQLQAKIMASASALKAKMTAPWNSAVAIVLGSGFKSFLDDIEVKGSINLADIPNFSSPKVAGHGSSLIHGSFEGQTIIALAGRTHLYEGYSAEEVVHPVRTLAQLGVKSLILTNASGSVNPDVAAGQIVALSDHINLTATNCLIGAKDLGAQFVDMVNAYNKDWRQRVLDRTGIKEAIYLGLLGPNYETPAETRMARSLGADLVGMSTVQETMAARQLGMTVLGLSLVTNMAGGLADEVNHEEVLEMGKSQGDALRKVLGNAIICAPNQ